MTTTIFSIFDFPNSESPLRIATLSAQIQPPKLEFSILQPEKILSEPWNLTADPTLNLEFFPIQRVLPSYNKAETEMS